MKLINAIHLQEKTKKNSSILLLFSDTCPGTNAPEPDGPSQMPGQVAGAFTHIFLPSSCFTGLTCKEEDGKKM
jgi:hypothetical protein